MSSPPDPARPAILQIIPRLDTGGAEQTTIDVAAAIVKAGGRALVATEGGRMVPQIADVGGEWVPFSAATKNPVKIIANALALRALIRREGIGIVHARSRAPAWSAYLATRGTIAHYVTTYHGAYNETNWLKAFYNGIMVRAEAIIANSQYTSDLIQGRYAGISDRIHVIPRGSDLARFAKDAVCEERCSTLRSAWDLSGSETVILLPARVTHWKGQMVVVEAARMLVEQGHLSEDAPGLGDLAIILAGDAQGRTDFVESLNTRIVELGLTETVRLVGHCADMPAAYALADVTVVPSIEPEAFGRTAVEAQAIGSMVVVSDIGATPETVLTPPAVSKEGRTGWRFPPGDADALAGEIVKILCLTEVEKQAIRARMVAHVRAHFSLEAMCAKTLNVYDQMLGSELSASDNTSDAL